MRIEVFFLMALLFTACRHDIEVFLPETEKVADSEELIDSASQSAEAFLPVYESIEGFYLLNEGNMGSNKSTLDYYDYSTGEYTRNIYGNANPNVTKELGDVGNDLAIYGSRLYAVINCSNKVEIMNKYTAERIGQIDIPNCRYIRFHEGYAYVTSYAGPVVISSEYKQRGYVAKVDTATLQVVDTCVVGFQPDELEIVGGKIYVANSGGYMVANYENTLSVIDLDSFKELRRIPVAVNLHHVRADNHGQLWISSRGDYYDVPSKLYCVNILTEELTDSIDLPVTDFHIDGDSLYLYGMAWSYITMDEEVNYAIVDVKSHAVVTRQFITDGTEESIRKPYGISVNPLSKDIYLTDAKNYVNPGTLYCFDKDGKKKWSVRTGDIPAHIVFLGKTKN